MTAGKTEEIKTRRVLLPAALPPPPPAGAWVGWGPLCTPPAWKGRTPEPRALGPGGRSQVSVSRPHPKFEL